MMVGKKSPFVGKMTEFDHSAGSNVKREQNLHV